MTVTWPPTPDTLPKPGSGTKTNDPGFELDVVITDHATLLERLETAVGDVAGRNLLINGSMEVDQNVGPYTTTGSRNNDGSYTLDGWILNSDGNNIVDVAQDTTAANLPTGSRAAMKMTVVTANKKFMAVQLLTARQCAEIIAGTASVEFYARTATSKVINNIRAAILSWSGTADSPTKDVVNSTNWGAVNVDPTWATSYTAENTPANLALTTSWQRFALDGVSIDTASAKQIALVIWCNDTDAAVGDELWITDVNLVPGPKAMPIVYQAQAIEELRCQFFYQKSYRRTVALGTASGNGAQELVASDNNTSKFVFITANLPVEMRTNPTISTYDRAGNSARISTYAADTSLTNNVTPSVGVVNVGTKSFVMAHSGTIAGISYHYVADARLGV